jgi:hypothetical protein
MHLIKLISYWCMSLRILWNNKLNFNSLYYEFTNLYIFKFTNKPSYFQKPVKKADFLFGTILALNIKDCHFYGKRNLN